MTYYFVRLRYSEIKADRSKFPDHQNHLRKLDEQGSLILSAPFSDGEGGLLFMKGKDIAEIKELIEDDPYFKIGRVKFEIHPMMIAKPRDIAVLRQGKIDYDFIIENFS